MTLTKQSILRESFGRSERKMRVEDVHVDGFNFFVKVKRRFLRVNKCLLPKKHSNENTRSQKSPHLDQGRSCNQIQLYGLNFLRCEPVQ